MDAATSASVIACYAPRGAVIFTNTPFSLTSHLNPSEDKHAAIYIGFGSVSRMLSVTGLASAAVCDEQPSVVESTVLTGVHVLSLESLLRDTTSVRVYVLDGDHGHLAAPAADVMAEAADAAFDMVGTPYGFGVNSMYCFKMVAACYARAGVDVLTERILGRDVVLSQSFKRDPRWRKMYDSETGLIDP
ncbi:conserved hypothetical pox protein required for murine virulence [Squirrelpox virus]|uniref:Protein OPG091 n=1 Tax=Squirrelpox virus TaxID=240426 RepID=U3UBC7_9POXV|nr:conserved hypothetical pox protein required for murine virulence [Squirrelpox virus]CCD83233.1 conserved hypothetical pox protein required for murine virulence [Squirrelpox virus]